MIFSKSFGYALRGVLYVAICNETRTKVQLEEMAGKLGIPRHFMGKVMKNLVKQGVISSKKGPYGGFYTNERTMATNLFTLVEVTGEVEEFSNCVLRFRKCNASRPCPLHGQMETLRRQWQRLLSTTTIGDLLNKEQPDFIRSIAAL